VKDKISLRGELSIGGCQYDSVRTTEVRIANFLEKDIERRESLDQLFRDPPILKVIYNRASNTIKSISDFLDG